MVIIGVTGSFGTGKSTVAGIFKKLGARVMDADKIAHGVIKRGTPAYAGIVGIFGKRILGPDGEIDRKKLGKSVFSVGKRKILADKLNRIIHPMVIKKMKQSISAESKKPRSRVMVLDVPLLIEAGMAGMVDKVVVVTAKKEMQASRVMKRSGMTKAGIEARIRCQMPIKAKIRHSDFVIDNSGTMGETKRKVKIIWEQIQQQTTRRKKI